MIWVISFSEEEGVEVDESLFQDMDDLDIDDDLEEAGDWWQFIN